MEWSSPHRAASRQVLEQQSRKQECQGPRAGDAGVARVQRLSVATGRRLVRFS